YSAPAMAVRMLRDVAMQQGTWDGPQGVEHGLMSELRRLTNVMAPGKTNGHTRGWDMVPFVDALRDGVIDRDDAGAIEGLLVFFSVVWNTAPRQSRMDFATSGVALSGAQ